MTTFAKALTLVHDLTEQYETDTPIVILNDGTEYEVPEDSIVIDLTNPDFGDFKYLNDITGDSGVFQFVPDAETQSFSGMLWRDCLRDWDDVLKTEKPIPFDTKFSLYKCLVGERTALIGQQYCQIIVDRLNLIHQRNLNMKPGEKIFFDELVRVFQAGTENGYVWIH